MKQAEIIVGTGFDRSGHKLHDIEGRIKRACQSISEHFGGYTMRQSRGGWFDGSKVVEEPGLSFLILTDREDESIRDEAEYIRDVFEQNSVALAVTPALVQFV
jgi:hypothetical protein